MHLVRVVRDVQWTLYLIEAMGHAVQKQQSGRPRSRFAPAVSPVQSFARAAFQLIKSNLMCLSPYFRLNKRLSSYHEPMAHRMSASSEAAREGDSFRHLISL